MSLGAASQNRHFHGRRVPLLQALPGAGMALAWQILCRHCVQRTEAAAGGAHARNRVPSCRAAWLHEVVRAFRRSDVAFTQLATHRSLRAGATSAIETQSSRTGSTRRSPAVLTGFLRTRFRAPSNTTLPCARSERARFVF